MATSEGSFCEATASSKPWHLTYSSEFKEVFIWKNGMRMKLKDGTSGGPVTSVSVLDAADRTITFKGFVQGGGQRYRCHLRLDTFTPQSDLFKKLVPLISDAQKFCTELLPLVDGAITFEASSSFTSVAMPTKSSTSTMSSAHSTITTGKRSSSGVETQSKRRKIKDDLDSLQKEISDHQIGVYSIPVSALEPPPVYLQVRDVKDWYVDYLVKMLLEEEDDHEDLTSPLLVLASVDKREFRMQNVDKYTFEVIGGIQRLYAIRRVNTMTGRKITVRKCAVYGKGLTRSAALVLANQHNQFNNIQRSTTFPEVAACCRRLLFTHFGDGVEDDGVNYPNIPHYNSHPYRAYKQECMTLLLSSQMSQAMIEQAIQMALLRGNIYSKMQDVFLKYEEGTLKGQKPRIMEGVTLQKALEGKLAPKLQHFKIFQGLEDCKKEQLLDVMLAGEIGYTEAEKESAEVKALTRVKDAMCSEVELDTWEEVEAAFPEFAKADVLKTFQIQKGKKPPKDFLAFCEKARASKGQNSLKIETVVKSKYISILAGSVAHIDFSGVGVILLNVKSVSSCEELEKMISAMKIGINGCTIAFYDIHGKPDPAEIEALCISCGAECGRVFRVSSVVKTDGGVSFATTEAVVLTWWGGTIPTNHILAERQEINSIVCRPDDEDTLMTTQQSTGWINLLLHPCPELVADVYSVSGELTQLCMAKRIQCYSVQSSIDTAKSFAESIGLQSESETVKEVSADPPDSVDTAALLEELSAVEKICIAKTPSGGEQQQQNEQHQHQSQEGNGQRVPKKKLGASGRGGGRAEGGAGRLKEVLRRRRGRTLPDVK